MSVGAPDWFRSSILKNVTFLSIPWIAGNVVPCKLYALYNYGSPKLTPVEISPALDYYYGVATLDPGAEGYVEWWYYTDPTTANSLGDTLAFEYEFARDIKFKGRGSIVIIATINTNYNALLYYPEYRLTLVDPNGVETDIVPWTRSPWYYRDSSISTESWSETFDMDEKLVAPGYKLRLYIKFFVKNTDASYSHTAKVSLRCDPSQNHTRVVLPAALTYLLGLD